jgi:hypothetical protein
VKISANAGLQHHKQRRDFRGVCITPREQSILSVLILRVKTKIAILGVANATRLPLLMP